ncbi:unnamed protein product [Microthlaspi erraticum]|uniref:Uncharacterized protein n=1 Tax=Microthlaspi erraticum TaxID=1685480 RepID=A0A6D2HL35_9BRAS|nr:unnamed protein product [Microthlaspi erraticum]
MSMKRIAEHNKKMKITQKAIDLLNEALKSNAESEKYFLERAAILGKFASNLESEGVDEHEPCMTKLHAVISSYLQSKGSFEEIAKEFADMQPPILEEIFLLQSLKKNAIEAFQDGGALTTKKKTRLFACFL